MSWLLRIFWGEPAVTPSQLAYEKAIAETDDLVLRMRDSSNSHDPARALLADIWQQRHNVPFLTSVYETVQEVVAPRCGNIEK